MDEDLEQSRKLAALIPLAYEELRRLAKSRVAQMRPGGTLSPSDLVNEVLLRLLKQEDRAYGGVDHLIRIAAQAMHNVLVDQVRRHAADKRGGKHAKRVDLGTDLPIAKPAEDMLSFDEACEAVRAQSEDYYELVLLRVYAGLSVEEIATHRGQSRRTILRQWRLVKAILRAHIDPNGTAFD